MAAQPVVDWLDGEGGEVWSYFVALALEAMANGAICREEKLAVLGATLQVAYSCVSLDDLGSVGIYSTEKFLGSGTDGRAGVLKEFLPVGGADLDGG